MFIDIVFDLKIAGVSAMKTGHKSVKQEFLHTFLQILQQHGFWQRAFWLLDLMAIETYQSWTIGCPRGQHNEINALMNMHDWKKPSVLYPTLFL